jgi:putative DNA primase/helicase
MTDLARQIPTDLTDITFDPGTPTHTAEWFRLEHSNPVPIKYVENIGWHVWTGKVWEPDPEGLRSRELLAAFIRRLNVQTFNTSYNKRYTLESRYLNNIMGALQLSTLTAANDMDALPSYLNCQNGVLDLTTFKLEPHDPSLNMTMITEAEYHEGVDQAWTQFVEEVLPDQETRQYLQRLVGLSLLGEVLQHTLPILQGSGSNGKSTMMMAVVHALGSYARVAESSLLMSGAGEAQQASPATLMLRGKRLVVTSETEDGKKLASAFVKQLTGGDMLTARALHKMPVTWEPTHSVFLLTNPMPVVDGSDKALFRRLKVIPFSVIFPPDKTDADLPKKLKLLSSSILAWAVAGLQDYQSNGIQEPAVITGATDEYRSENDATSSFITDTLEFGTGTITVPELTHALHEFQQDIDPKYKITHQKLNRTLRQMGATQGKLRIEGKPTNVWNGVSFKS